MKKSLLSKNNISRVLRGQAIVEFAIALPILLALLIGILEVGRLIFIYSAVTNASRNASRYASAVGLNDSGYYKYMHCEGIREIARKSTYLVPGASLSIDISYDGGPGTASKVTDGCDSLSGNDEDVKNAGVTTGDRVTVTVATEYQPLTRLIPISPRTVSSTSSRTILGIVDLKP